MSAEFAPYLAPRELFDAVLIDDDVLVQMAWKLAAEGTNRKIICFSRPHDFFEYVNHIDVQSPVFIDVSLGDGLRGEIVAENVANLGFGEIYLSTGHNPESIVRPHCVKAVLGKDPKFISHQL